jgi:hypothetical protein
VRGAEASTPMAEKTAMFERLKIQKFPACCFCRGAFSAEKRPYVYHFYQFLLVKIL